MYEKLWAIREQVREKKPLVFNLTNNVVTNFTANVLLAAGASPIMSEGPDEAEELARIADAIIINIGTLHPRQIDNFFKVGEKANKYDKKLVLDPVGVGATEYRNRVAARLIEQLRFTLIRGNSGEISFLAGAEFNTKGVDSLDSQIDSETLKKMSQRTGSLVCATGVMDFLSDGEKICRNGTGNVLLQTVTGTGCALTSVIGAFLAVSEEPLSGALSALAFYGAAAEKAAATAKGPGTFGVNFIDALYNLSYDEFSTLSAEKVALL